MSRRPDRHPFQGDPFRELRALKWRVRLLVYPCIVLLIPFDIFVLGRPWLEALLSNAGGYLVATIGIEFGFVHFSRLRKQSAYPSTLAVELAPVHDLNKACDLGLEKAAGWLGARAAVLACLHRSRQGLEATAFYGMPRGWLASERRSWSNLRPFLEAIESQQVLVRPLGPDDIWAPHFKGNHLVAYVPVVSLDKVIGVMSFVGNRGKAELKDVKLLTAIGIIMGLALDNVRLYDHEYQGILHILCSALDRRDRVTEGHSRRVARLSIVVARELNLNGDTLLDIERAAILHDIGKIAVPDAILSKSGPLTDEEWAEMRGHPIVGHELVRDVPFLSHAAEIVYAHHERFDGTGYPRGLKGEDIPIGARIFAVVDAYDAITSDRPYRKARPHEYALEEIRHHAGTQFDPQVVEAFLNCARRGDIRRDGSQVRWSSPSEVAAALVPPAM